MSTTVLKHSSKTQALGEHLTRMALSLAPDTKLPTMQELRRELNVSIATLDSPLTKLESQNVIYRKHGIGIFVSPRIGEKCIGLVVGPENFQAGTSPFWQELIEGMRTRAEDKGESSRFYLALPGRDGRPVKEDLAEDIDTGRLNGVIFIGHNVPAVNWIEEQGVPLVGFAGVMPHKVLLDYDTLIEVGVRRLAERGCRRIAFLKSRDEGDFDLVYPEMSSLGRQFEECLNAVELPLDVRLLQDYSYFDATGTTRQMQGFESVQRLWELPEGERPDALLINDDMMTRGALVALGKMGVQIGRNLQVATHANRGSAVLHGYEDELIRIEFDAAELVSALFDLLEQRMDGLTGEFSNVYVRPHIGS